MQQRRRITTLLSYRGNDSSLLVSWHRLSWWKGTFGSLHGNYVFILLAEIKVMMRKEIRSNSDRAQEMLRQKKQQQLFIHQDKIQAEIRRLNLKWLKRGVHQTEISKCKKPRCFFSDSLLILQSLENFKISILTPLMTCLDFYSYCNQQKPNCRIIERFELEEIFEYHLV